MQSVVTALVLILLVIAGVGIGLGLVTYRKYRVTCMVRFPNQADHDMYQLIINSKARYFSGGDDHGGLIITSDRLVLVLEEEGYTISGVSNSHVLFHLVGAAVWNDRSIFTFCIDPRFHGTLNGKNIVLVPRDEMLERASSAE